MIVLVVMTMNRDHDDDDNNDVDEIAILACQLPEARDNQACLLLLDPCVLFVV